MVALGKRLLVEGSGTAWVVFIGCGSVVLNTGAPQQGYSVLEMSLAFGLALVTASYAFGTLSGAHFNPAVTIGFTVAQRFPVRDLLPYIAAQILGATAAAGLLAYVASGRPGFDLAASEFAANGFGDHSPADYQLHSALVIELVLSFAFVMASLMLASRRRSRQIAPLVIGACLTIVYMVSIPVTNGSINPARSTSQALFVGNWALDQLWLFWAAPLLGGVAAGALFSFLCCKSRRYAASFALGQGEVA
ncbi:aquaporin Z [Paraburkholderia fungorum]|jgi:aquaporin Z|uniref:Aquaporin Z 2 n=1 Tax=Paraburkholderia fungorum TaxID=134537 RepID=A0AAU8TEN1_9BURK|nr:aquaporin Z [Paraburkholderia fungorum]KFX63098.1 porin [Burkholderia sp. K24]AJZ58851.1 aquaporin Z 2 [Paraburkholderia fungorum]MBB5544485.1 aquaporin Z [Paraburkholderia fungorum]PNE58635.1 aquaporin Z [Paraburkholderia fungorum]USU18424.1 aquaporin Z [Paraburkholderia fungorum]